MKHNPIIKALTLILVFCIADIYVLADVTKPNASAKNAATNINHGKLLLGRLWVPHHQDILVNGHSAMSGDIVTSGSRLQTPSAVIPATVDLGLIGKLEIAAATDLFLTFDQRNVEVKVAAGNAALSTSDGVKGAVRMPDGRIAMSSRSGNAQNRPTVGFLFILPVIAAVIALLVSGCTRLPDDTASPVTISCVNKNSVPRSAP